MAIALYVELSELLRESVAGSGGVPQTPGVNQQHGLGPQVKVARECGTECRLCHPGQRE